MVEFKKFKKKPVVVDAFQYTTDIPQSAIINLGFYPDKIDGFIIPTLEGAVRINLGDWVIKDGNGEYYSCRSDTFEKNYEEIND